MQAQLFPNIASLGRSEQKQSSDMGFGYKWAVVMLNSGGCFYDQVFFFSLNSIMHKWYFNLCFYESRPSPGLSAVGRYRFTFLSGNCILFFSHFKYAG